jgi:hypothetical protein
MDPAFELQEIEIFVNRTTSFGFDLYDVADAPLVISAADGLRFVIWDADGEAPLLDCDLTGTTSKVIATALGIADDTPARATVRIHEDDTAGLTPGTYQGELILIDDSDDGVSKPLCRMPIKVTGSAAEA